MEAIINGRSVNVWRAVAGVGILRRCLVPRCLNCFDLVP
nr:hypothetical protein [Kibdelosporangium sp. MJ126-NF4]CTQ89668.1 hypothetical protein [Kibdelosporangium sp. MJ126-NF4]